jgi:hypothetical protein
LKTYFGAIPLHVDRVAVVPLDRAHRVDHGRDLLVVQ